MLLRTPNALLQYRQYMAFTATTSPWWLKNRIFKLFELGAEEKQKKKHALLSWTTLSISNSVGAGNICSTGLLQQML